MFMTKALWVEKWRPKNISDYVFKDPQQKEQMQKWIAAGALPHLLFSGAAGTGKTTAALVLLNELGVDKGDIKIINGSSENGVDYIRDIVSNFASTMPFGEFKYILIDEADYISQNGQAALRNVMEKYSNTCRFILTCNFNNKILPAIHSRCQGFHITSLDKQEYTIRVANILISENIEFEIDLLDEYVNATYPDMRKTINTLQQNSTNGVLTNISNVSQNTDDFKLQAIALFKQRMFKEARELICKQIQIEEYEDFYRFMYNNLEFWVDTDYSKMQQAILVIRNGLVKHSAVADVEINLSATLVELEMIATG